MGSAVRFRRPLVVVVQLGLDLLEPRRTFRVSRPESVLSFSLLSPPRSTGSSAVRPSSTMAIGGGYSTNRNGTRRLFCSCTCSCAASSSPEIEEQPDGFCESRGRRVPRVAPFRNVKGSSFAREVFLFASRQGRAQLVFRLGSRTTPRI